MKNARPDIMGHLLAHTENTLTGRAILNADSRVIIGAGSDTTASALTILFVLLAVHPNYQERLREEVSTSFTDNTFNCGKPQALLDAIITESLRLFPPVTFCSQRVIPAGGLTVGKGKIYIPEDTVVSIATYQVQHDARNFVQPNEFVPERWTSQPELVLNKTAYMPFSTGPYNCIGKGLAMMELRSVIARTVNDFDISIPNRVSFDEKSFYGNIKDHFTMGVPGCKMQFIKRVSA